MPRDWCAPPLTWAHVYKMVHRHTTVLQLQQPLHSELLVPLELSLLQTRRSARFASMPEAHGAAVDLADAHGSAPLRYAAQHGHAEVARALLQRGAQPDRTNDHCHSPLWLAAYMGDAAGGYKLLGIWSCAYERLVAPGAHVVA